MLGHRLDGPIGLRGGVNGAEDPGQSRVMHRRQPAGAVSFLCRGVTQDVNQQAVGQSFHQHFVTLAIAIQFGCQKFREGYDSAVVFNVGHLEMHEGGQGGHADLGADRIRPKLSAKDFSRSVVCGQIEATASELLDRFGRCLGTINDFVSNAITQDNQVAFVELRSGTPVDPQPGSASPDQMEGQCRAGFKPKAPAAAGHTPRQVIFGMADNTQPVIKHVHNDLLVETLCNHIERFYHCASPDSSPNMGHNKEAIMAKTILVTAATGTVGQHLVPRLLARGHNVKAASRSASSSQDNSVLLDFARPETFGGALAGVDAAYLVIPSGTADPLALADFINAAAAASVKLVMQSAMGVDASEDIPYRKLERLIEKSGTPYVLLRPNWFFDNFHTYWLKGILGHGLIALPAGDAKTSFIDARDIADAAVATLTTSDHDGQAFTLTGAESFSYAEAAEILSAVLGRTIRYEAVDTTGFLNLAPKLGLSEIHGQMLAPIFYPVAQGWASADTGDTARLTGRLPRQFVDYIADNAARFR